MNRLANPKDGGQYAFYYSVIKGWDDVGAGKAKTVSGITTPDDKTIVFHLTKPTGDFNLRMGMPATAPIPPEVGACFEGKPGAYGRDVISTGPYMIKGADAVKLPCAALKPMAGYAGDNGQKLILVRNPNYDQSTDDYRKNYPDQFDFVVNSNADDIYNKVQAGQYDDEQSSPQPKTIRQYVTDPNLKKRLLANQGDRTWYITMNLTQPPFDDIHIRKAMNLIIDKQALRKAWGGPVIGSIGTHIAPPVMYNNGLAEYDPYATPNHSGDVAKAEAEIKLSKYDPGKTGKCTAAACKNVLMIADTRALDGRMVPVIEGDAAKIGHHLQGALDQRCVHDDPDHQQEHPDVRAPGLGQGLRRPVHVLRRALRQPRTHPVRQHELLARRHHAGDQQAKKLGVTGNLNGIPSVNGDIDTCQAKIGQDRTNCWENARQEADDAGRPVGPVPVGQQRHHRRPERHALELRPVQ